MVDAQQNGAAIYDSQMEEVPRRSSEADMEVLVHKRCLSADKYKKHSPRYPEALVCEPMFSQARTAL